MRGLIFLHVLVVDLQPLLHVGPEVLDHHVGLLDHAAGRPRGPPCDFRLSVMLALVAVQVLEVGALARAARRVAARRVRRHLDLDDIGAPVGELAHAGRARPHAGQVENGEARKRLGCLGNSHRRNTGKGYRSGRTFPDIPKLVYGSPSRTRTFQRSPAASAPLRALAVPLDLPRLDLLHEWA